MGQHTPGPWKIVGPDRSPRIMAGEVCIAATDQQKKAYEGTMNAYLIAAAPDLMAACEAFIAARSNAELHAALNLACDAVTKAKG